MKDNSYNGRSFFTYIEPSMLQYVQNTPKENQRILIYVCFKQFGELVCHIETWNTTTSYLATKKYACERDCMPYKNKYIPCIGYRK